MKKCVRISEILMERSTASNELLSTTPIVEICDKERVLIENHHGIIQYGNEDICVKVRFGGICVTGKNLKLNRMSRTKLVITGKINGVIFRESEGDSVV